MLDNHQYQCFGEYWNNIATLPRSWETHLKAACKYGSKVDALKHHSFTGEFSIAVTDCQKYLDGGYGEPYVPKSKYHNVPFQSFDQS